jgi:hypothetical protein
VPEFNRTYEYAIHLVERIEQNQNGSTLKRKRAPRSAGKHSAVSIGRKVRWAIDHFRTGMPFVRAPRLQRTDTAQWMA